MYGPIIGPLVCLEIFIEGESTLLLNIYVPFGLEVISIREFALLLKHLDAIPHSELIVCGDFNLPNIKWNPDEDPPGSFAPLNFYGEKEHYIYIIFKFNLRPRFEANFNSAES